MKKIIEMFWSEPAFATQIPTVILASAAGIWQNEWLAFGAAAMAAVGAIVTRQNVSPVDRSN